MPRDTKFYIETLLSMWLSFFVSGLCVMVLAGWAFDLPALVQPIPNTSPTQVSTALSILLIALPFSGITRNSDLRTASFIGAVAIALLSFASHFSPLFNFINQMGPQKVLEPGATAGQMSKVSALFIFTLGMFGICDRCVRPSLNMVMAAQAFMVVLLGTLITSLALIFTNMTVVLKFGTETTTIGTFTAMTLIIMAFVFLMNLHEEHSMPLRLPEMTEMVATAAILGTVMFFGAVLERQHGLASHSKTERIELQIDRASTEARRTFMAIAADAFGEAPIRSPHAARVFETCRLTETTDVLTLDISLSSYIGVNCEFAMSPEVDLGVGKRVLHTINENWQYRNPTHAGYVLRQCPGLGNCHLFMTVATHLNPETGFIHVLTLDLEPVLLDYLRFEGLKEAKIDTIDFVSFAQSVPDGALIGRTLEIFIEHLEEVGISTTEFATERISLVTRIMILILLLSVIAMFILMQQSQRNYMRFREASRQLVLRHAYSRRFVYAAAHDLRAPLRGIEQLSNWARDDLETGETATASRYMSLISARIEHLSALIEGILDLARLDNRENKIENQRISDAIEAATSLYRSPMVHVATRVQPENLTLHYEYEGLVRVLNNLLANAVSHHDQDIAHILVDAKLSGNELVIGIQDDGPGIPESQHEMIFEMFKTYSDKEKHAGVGMGLAMVRRLVEEWAGEISVISPTEAGRGTRFEIRVPMGHGWGRTR